MSTQSSHEQVHARVVTGCQAEIQQMVKSLQELGEITGLESWSPSIRQTYRLALDDLAALEAYLQLFTMTLSDPVPEERKDPDETVSAS